MNFRNLAQKAKAALKGEHVDRAAEAAKGRFGQHSDKIDKLAGHARKYVDKGRNEPGFGPGRAGGTGPGEPGGTGQPLP